MSNNDPKLITNEEGNLVYEDSPWTPKTTYISPINPTRRSLGNNVGAILIVGESGNPSVINKLSQNEVLGVDEQGNWAGLSLTKVTEAYHRLSELGLDSFLEQLENLDLKAFVKEVDFLNFKTDTEQELKSLRDKQQQQQETLTDSIPSIEENIQALTASVTDFIDFQTTVTNEFVQIKSNHTSLVSRVFSLESKTDTLTIKGSTEQGDLVNKKFSELEFDNQTGFNVEDLGTKAKVSLGSHFKTITVNGEENVVAEGEDTLSLNFGQGILVETSSEANDKRIDISISEVTSTNPSNSFLVNVQPVSAEGTINASLSLDELSIESFVTNTTEVEITIEFDGGQNNYRGFYTVNGLDFDSYSKVSARTFQATKVISLEETLQGILTIQGNGSELSIPYSELISGQVIEASLIGLQNPEPNQVSAKWGDKVDLLVEGDTAFKEVIIVSGDFSTGIIETTLSSQNIVTITVSNTNVTFKQSSAVIRIRDENDGLSDPFTVTNAITIDNIVPQLSITPPSNTTALKEEEVVGISFTAENQDSIVLSSSELVEVNRSNSSLNVGLSTEGITKGYRDNGTNFNVIARKESNASTVTRSGLVKIANDLPTVDSSSNSRLRSIEGSEVIRTINVNFDQELSNLSVETPLPQGILVNVTGSNKIWAVNIEISHTMIHQSDPYVLNLTATNLASVQSEQTINYYLQGFEEVVRTIDTNTTLQTSVIPNIVNKSNLIVQSVSPPLTYAGVDTLSGEPDEIVVEGSTITFDSSIRNFLTGNDPIGSLTVTIKEIL